MSDKLLADLAATCSALGYYDATTKKYYADENTLETVKDLIRYLRRDDENHDIRRQLGDTQVLQTDLLPMLKSYWEETELFDVLLRLLVNLTTPAIVLWNEEIPTEKITRNYYMQIADHLKSYKEAFVDPDVWSVLSRRLSKTLEVDYTERGDEKSLVIERILILLRNILYVPIDPNVERPDDDASVHDQVLWSLHQSGMLDIILYIASSPAEQAYYMHILEILCFMLREQKASDLAQAALQRSETEKIRDEAELLAVRHREALEKQKKMKKYTGARHSRFGGTYVVTSMKSISDNELIYHKPLNKIDELNFDADKKRLKTPKNRMPITCPTYERRSAFSVRLFLKEFCIEFLNGAYNTFIGYVKKSLVRGKGQDNDESYYFWAVRFFMEMKRCYKFDIKLVSETMSIETFHYIQREMEKQFDLMQTDKKHIRLSSRRLHLALLAYRELLLTLCAMDRSKEDSVRNSSKVIKSNIFYVPEYRELILTLLVTYDELKSSDLYLKDLIETQHIFLKMLEKFCGTTGSVVVKNKSKSRKKKKSTNKTKSQPATPNYDALWDEVAPQLTAILEMSENFTSDVAPFDAGSDIPIDEQKADAMKNIQRKLRNGEFEGGIGLLHAAREVWPENDEFGNLNMSKEDEFTALKDIFFAELGEDENPVIEQPSEQEDDEEDDFGDSDIEERELKIGDFIKRLAHPKIVRGCSLALKTFESNSVTTNNCIVKLLHRIAFDCKMYVMLFQLSIFRTFQNVFKVKELPQYKELVKFAIYIIRQFFKVAEKNKKVIMETLFWKSSREAFEIEEGYDAVQNKQTTTAWTDEEEDELRRLFIEHREKEIDEDVVDWITENLINDTRTRKQVLKKLKQLMLITAPPPKCVRAPKVWGDEEEEELTQLFDQFKDASDPVGCIIQRMSLKRPRNRIIEKLLVMGLIQDRKEVYKKRSGKKGDEDMEDDMLGLQITGNKPKTIKKNSGKLSKPEKFEIVKLLLGLENELDDALDWLKDCLSDAVEDIDDNSDSDGLPLVPIMDHAVEAMQNEKFLDLLRSIGIMEPEQGQVYWRIPAMISASNLQELIGIITQAIEKTLKLPAEGSKPKNSTSTSSKKRNASKQNNQVSKPDKSENQQHKVEIVKLLLNLENNLSDALDWLKDCLSDAIDCFEDLDNDDSDTLPLIPIANHAGEAMQNENFLQLLRSMGIIEPEQDQVYWRIPATISESTLKEFIEIITQAIEKTLKLPESASNPKHSSATSKKKRDKSKQNNSDHKLNKIKNKNNEERKLDIMKLLIKLENELGEALDWLKDCLEDAADSFEDPDHDESDEIPVVPITDTAVEAIENEEFLKLLKLIGIVEPEQGQTYWRIPGTIPTNTIKELIEIITQAINKTLQLCEGSTKTKKHMTEDDSNFLVLSDEANKTSQHADQNINGNNKIIKKRNRIINSESDSENEDLKEQDNFNKVTAGETIGNGNTLLVSDDEETGDDQEDLITNVIGMSEDVNQNGKSNRKVFKKINRIIDSDSENEDFKEQDDSKSAIAVKASGNVTSLQVSDDEDSENNKENFVTNIITETSQDVDQNIKNNEVIKKRSRIIDSDSENDYLEEQEVNLSKAVATIGDESDKEIMAKHKRPSKRFKLIDSDDET